MSDSMLGHFILVERNSTVEPTRQEDPADPIVAFLGSAGFARRVAASEDVSGAEIWSTAKSLQDAHPDRPLAMFAITQDPRWMLLSDLTEALMDAGRQLAELSERVGGRVVAVRFAPEESGLRWFEAGRLRRRVEQLRGGISAEGEPLPIEVAFGGSVGFDEDGLLTLVQSLGIDIGRLNSDAAYRLWAFPA